MTAALTDRLHIGILEGFGCFFFICVGFAVKRYALKYLFAVLIELCRVFLNEYKVILILRDIRFKYADFFSVYQPTYRQDGTVPADESFALRSVCLSRYQVSSFLLCEDRQHTKP